MTNLYHRLAGVLATDRSLQIVTVISTNNGTSLVESPAGNRWTVLGNSVTAGNKAVIQDGKVISQAADVPTYEVSV